MGAPEVLNSNISVSTLLAVFAMSIVTVAYLIWAYDQRKGGRPPLFGRPLSKRHSRLAPTKKDR